MTLSLNEYQARTEITAVYPEAGTGHPLALAYVGLGLGEAGEVQGKIKKILREDNEAMAGGYNLAIAKEVGDLLWYAARMCTELGYTMGEVAQMNLDKLEDRMNRGTLKGAGDER